MEFAERVECRCYASRTLLSEVFLRDDQPDRGGDELGVACGNLAVRQCQHVLESHANVVPGRPPRCHYLPCSVAVTVPQLWHTSWNELRDRACFRDAAVDLHKRPTS